MSKANGVFEQEGGVVDGGIAPGELLEKLSGRTNQHALELLRLAASEERFDAAAVASSFDISLDEVEIGNNLLIIFDSAVESGEHFASFHLVAVLDEPARRFGQDGHANTHDDGEDDLESDGESPLHRAVDIAETEIDPIGDEGSHSDDGALETDEESTVLGLRSLGLPDGNGRSVHAVADARNDSSHDELSHGPGALEADGGDDGTDDEDDAASQANARAANLLAVHESEDGTEEAADFVTSRDGAANDRNVLRVSWAGVRWNESRREFVVELVTRNEARHEALIVTEEGEAHDGGDGDGRPELLASKAAGAGPHVGAAMGGSW